MTDFDALRKAESKLIAAAWMRIVDAAVWTLAGVLVAATAGWMYALGALLVATCLAFVADQLVRRRAVVALGENSGGQRRGVIHRALDEAAKPLGIETHNIHPRRIEARGEIIPTAFAASVLPVANGLILLLGQTVMGRARDAVDTNKEESERRFAYDEVRAVFGHELAHNLPGTYASSRLPSLLVRVSGSVVATGFWLNFAVESVTAFAVGALVFLSLKRLTRGKPQMQGFKRVVTAAIALLAVLAFDVRPVLAVVYLLWPVVRPISSMAVQRRTEHACDRVAVMSGADPSALARILQRFEPEKMRYRTAPLWQRLNSTHPPLHKRIVDLDHMPLPGAPSGL